MHSLCTFDLNCLALGFVCLRILCWVMFWVYLNCFLFALLCLPEEIWQVLNGSAYNKNVMCIVSAHTYGRYTAVTCHIMTLVSLK
jgi:hypothetical protein